ncbi:MAG: hypothetical protein ABI851_03030 [Saprospiraceae bacterium]
MHDIEPYYLWQDTYISSEDERSPFYGSINDEFRYTNKIYNYYIHPQWDSFDSTTLYLKLLFADYEEKFVIIELIGEWNDCIENDIMYLKREVIDPLIKEGINKYILLVENVFNFHGSDSDYYEEWKEEISEDDGWICMVNVLDHVFEEMKRCQLHFFMNFGKNFNDILWQKTTPTLLYELVSQRI